MPKGPRNLLPLNKKLQKSVYPSVSFCFTGSTLRSIEFTQLAKDQLTNKTAFFFLLPQHGPFSNSVLFHFVFFHGAAVKEYIYSLIYERVPKIY